MKKLLTLLLVFSLVISTMMPVHAAAAMDKSHLKLIQDYFSSQSTGDLKKFKSLLGSNMTVDESTAVDFETTKKQNVEGIAKFYFETSKISKKSEKNGVFTYKIDAYYFQLVDGTAGVVKLPIELSVKKFGKSVKLTNEVLGEAVGVENMKDIPKSVLAEINKDCKAKFEMTYEEMMTE